MWKNGLDFGGTANRKDFWMAFLFNFLAAMICGVVVAIGFIWLYVIYGIAVLIPGIAITVRRLRDGGHSPFAIFIGLVPFVGGIILLVWLIKE